MKNTIKRAKETSLFFFLLLLLLATGKFAQNPVGRQPPAPAGIAGGLDSVTQFGQDSESRTALKMHFFETKYLPEYLCTAASGAK